MSNVKEIAGETSLPSSLPRLLGSEPLSQLGERHAVGWNQVALDMVADSVLFFSTPTARLANVNLAACRQLGFSRQEMRHMSLADIAPHAKRGNLAEQITRVVRGSLQDAHVETVYRRQDSTLLPVNCSIRALQHQPNNLLVAVARSIQSGDSHSNALINAPIRDPLTGLANREWFVRQLELATDKARQNNHRFAVLFIDVDRFKAVNDSFGHLVGDQVLQAVAKRLVSNVRPGDTVARYGGDEFVVLMQNYSGARSIARIAARIGRQISAAGTLPADKRWQVQITMSIGVAVCGGALSAPMSAIEFADRAMYRAKALGRNGQFVIEDLSELRCG